MKCHWKIATALCLAAASLSAQAQDAVGCIDVSVGGYKAPDYDCLSRQMGSEPNAAEAQQRNQAAMDDSFNRRSPSQKGLATPAATATRMGNTFGTGVKPQRPPAPTSGSPLIKAP